MKPMQFLNACAGRAGLRLGALVPLLFALAGNLLVPAPPALALDRRSGVVVVPAGETVADDLFASGNLLRIDGTVQGDVYALAQNVTVSGTVEGDLIVAAQQVTVDGQVRGSVRAAGASVQVNGAVGRNVTTMAQSLHLASGGRVAGNLLGAGETISLDGDVGGAAGEAARDVMMQGRVGRDAEVSATSLIVGPNARIGRNLTYYSETQIDVPAGAVGGQTIYHAVQPVPRNHQQPTTLARRAGAFGNFFSLAWLAGSAIVGLLVVRLFPRFVASFFSVLETQPLPSLGLGVLALIGTLPVAFLLALTVVGIPIAGLLLASYFSGIFLGWLLLASAAGTIILGLLRRGHAAHRSWAFVLGLVLLYAAGRIPVIWPLVVFLGWSFGLGALIITLLRSRRGATLSPAPMPAIPTYAPPTPA